MSRKKVTVKTGASVPPPAPAPTVEEPSREVVAVKITGIVIGQRIRQDFPDVPEIASDIEERGLQYPIRVTSDLRLIDGEQRIRAFQYLGREEIPAIVEDVPDVLEAEIALNVQRSSFNDFEAVDAADRLMEKYRRPVGRPKKGEGTEISANLPEFLGDRERLEDWAAKKAGLGCRRNYFKVKEVRANAHPDVQKAMISKAISRHLAYEISQQKKDVQITWLNEAISDDDTDRKKLRELAEKRREAKRLAKAGIDPDKRDDPTDEFPNSIDMYNLIRAAPDFYASKVETLAQFPIHKHGGHDTLVFIECNDTQLDKAFALGRAWRLVYKLTLRLEPVNGATIMGAAYLTDKSEQPVNIVVFAYHDRKNRCFERAKTRSTEFCKTPRFHAPILIRKIFGPYAEQRLLDISSREPCPGWTVCFTNYGYGLF
jgi:ParB-like chromosome segregation protein Spo0J